MLSNVLLAVANDVAKQSEVFDNFALGHHGCVTATNYL